MPPHDIDEQRAHQAAFARSLETKPEFILLAPLTHSPPHGDPADVAQSIARLSHTALERSNTSTNGHAASDPAPATIGSQAYDTACCAVELAMRTAPHAQGPLVACLAQLQTHTVADPADPSGSRALILDEEDRFWADLPTFGYTLADELGACDAVSPHLLAEEKARYENLNAFCARLTSDGVRDFSAWGCIAFGRLQGWFRPAGMLGSGCSLQVIARWVEFAGRVMWEKAEMGPEREISEDGIKGFDVQQWDSWVRELEMIGRGEVVARDCLTQEDREMAMRIAGMMREIDQRHA